MECMTQCMMQPMTSFCIFFLRDANKENKQTVSKINFAVKMPKFKATKGGKKQVKTQEEKLQAKKLDFPQKVVSNELKTPTRGRSKRTFQNEKTENSPVPPKVCKVSKQKASKVDDNTNAKDIQPEQDNSQGESEIQNESLLQSQQPGGSSSPIVSQGEIIVGSAKSLINSLKQRKEKVQQSPKTGQEAELKGKVTAEDDKVSNGDGVDLMKTTPIYLVLLVNLNQKTLILPNQRIVIVGIGITKEGGGIKGDRKIPIRTQKENNLIIIQRHPHLLGTRKSTVAGGIHRLIESQ